MKFQTIVDKTVHILEQAPDELAPSMDTPPEGAGTAPVPVDDGSALPTEPDVDASQINEGKVALLELARKAFLAGLYYTSSEVDNMFRDPGDYGIITSVVTQESALNVQDVLNYIVRDFYPDTDID